MNRKILVLLGSLIIGFIVFIVIHFSFLKILHSSKIKANNVMTKQIISNDINYNILKIKTQFLQIPLVSNNIRTLNLNYELLKSQLQKTKKLLLILKNGGVYIKKIPLNVVGKDYFKKEFVYKKCKTSIETINLIPKIEFLENKAHKLYISLKYFLELKKQHKLTLKYFKKERREIVRFSKGLESVFRRMIEDSNRLFYESQQEFMQIENKLKHKTETYQTIEFSLIIFLISMFVIGGWFIFRELHNLNESLKEKLYIDELTKVFSRAKLEEIETTDKSVLILIDIDGFSDINELYGVEVGNKVLQIFADKLKKINKNFDVFRVSADVFGLYLDDYNKLDMSIEDKILTIRNKLIFEPIIVDDNSIDINITIGVAFGKNILHDALAALNMAKDDNVIYTIFHEENEFKAKIEFNKKWQEEIKYAIANDSIVPFFQPIVDKDKNIIKYEVLMRMYKNGKYFPPIFLDVAVKTKQYIALSRIVIEKAFIAFKDGGEFSINLNYIDMKTESTRDFLEELIIKYNAKGRVTFEILESEGINDYNLIRDFLDYFKKFNVKVAIDDFGSGYSNFKRIMELKPDYIKLDGSLIKNIATDSESFLIVKTMINYAKELNIKTVAEFIHNKDTFDTCLYLGIDYFQGYYVGKPTKDIS